MAARDGIEPPTPAFSGPPSNSAKLGLNCGGKVSNCHAGNLVDAIHELVCRSEGLAVARLSCVLPVGKLFRISYFIYDNENCQG